MLYELTIPLERIPGEFWGYTDPTTYMVEVITLKNDLAIAVLCQREGTYDSVVNRAELYAGWAMDHVPELVDLDPFHDVIWLFSFWLRTQELAAKQDKEIQPWKLGAAWNGHDIGYGRMLRPINFAEMGRGEGRLCEQYGFRYTPKSPQWGPLQPELPADAILDRIDENYLSAGHPLVRPLPEYA